MAESIVITLSSDEYNLLLECVQSSLTFLDGSLKLPLKKTQKIAIRAKKADIQSLLDFLKLGGENNV